MPFVITVAQQKGGTGKTTLAANIAAALAPIAQGRAAGHRSAAQPDTMARAAARIGPGLTFSDVSGWRLAGELDRLKAAHDAVVIDSPPQVDTDARQAIRAATIVLIPVQLSPPDIWAAEGTLKLAAAEKRRAAMVLNRVPASGKLRETMMAQLTASAAPLLTAIDRQPHRLCRGLRRGAGRDRGRPSINRGE